MKQEKFDIEKLKKGAEETCFLCIGKMSEEDVIYEDDKFIAALDLYPATKGYTLVATKKHIENLTELSEKEYAEFQNIVYRCAEAIKKAFSPPRICLFQTGGLVSHFHFHVMPMYENMEKVMDVFARKEGYLKFSEEERKEIAENIKKHL